MTALLLLSHEAAPRVRRMVDYWLAAVGPCEVVVAYGGPWAEFGALGCRKAFIDDPRLRTRDHQRERQSYTGVLRGALEALGGADWEWLYLAEYDMLPLDPALLGRLRERAIAEGADLLGHRMWRLEDTLHPHYASHLATPAWQRWVAGLSCRPDVRVVLSCMGCGQFWRREALEEVIARGEPHPAYLELHLPTVAHHLGFRARGLRDQDRFISNVPIPGAKPELLRDTGAWVMHPLKDLWSGEFPFPERLPGGDAPAARPALPPLRIPQGDDSSERGWLGDLRGLLGRIARVATGSSPVRVVRGGQRLAIGLPRDRRAARVVLDLYHPHRLKGRLFRLLVRFLLATRLYAGLRATGTEASVEPEVEWLRQLAGEGMVGFVGGNPSHGPRCLLGGLGGAGEQGKPFVGKLGFDESRAAIVREAKVLQQLATRYPGVLRPLSFDSGPDWALLRLPYLGYRTPAGMDDPAVAGLLVDWWGNDWKAAGDIAWAAQLLARAERSGADSSWVGAMRGRRVRVALVHGDFAVWNLRLLPVGPCAIDWEWAVEEGIAGIDLAHGLRQEAVMIRKLAPARAVSWILRVAARDPWAAHLRACGWDGELEQWLRLGLLHSHFHANSDSREMLDVLGIRLADGGRGAPGQTARDD